VLFPVATPPVIPIAGTTSRSAARVYPLATIRANCVGSVPSVTLTFIPGFRSAILARRPLTVTSVNGEIVYVFVALSTTLPSSVTVCTATVTEFAVTCEMIVCWWIRVGVGRGLIETLPASDVQTTPTARVPSRKEQTFLVLVTFYRLAVQAIPAALPPIRFPLLLQSDSAADPLGSRVARSRR